MHSTGYGQMADSVRAERAVRITAPLPVRARFVLLCGHRTAAHPDRRPARAGRRAGLVRTHGGGRLPDRLASSHRGSTACHHRFLSTPGGRAGPTRPALQPPGDRPASTECIYDGRAQAPEAAGAQPPAVEHLAGSLRALPVAMEHDRPPGLRPPRAGAIRTAQPGPRRFKHWCRHGQSWPDGIPGARRRASHQAHPDRRDDGTCGTLRPPGPRQPGPPFTGAPRDRAL
jgi:hypothetical protein